MPVLVSDDDLINIVVHYTISKNKYGYKLYKPLSLEEAHSWLADPEKAGRVEEFHTQWRPPTWQMQNEIVATSMSYNPVKGEHEINWRIFRELRMKKCLISWNVTDENGRAVPVTEQNIENLNPVLGNALNNKYDEITSMEEEEGEK